MKVAILAGGKGTRLAEETVFRPKPMVKIGGRPILWHIMKHYARYGFADFTIALGYKGEVIERYFAEEATAMFPGPVDSACGRSFVLQEEDGAQNWQVDLVKTGDDTLTAGRIKRLKPYLGEGTFMLTWGDGLSDVNIRDLLAFHKSHGKLATVTAVRPPARFGHLTFEGDRVTAFEEKPAKREGWINGAFFVLEPEVLSYIDGDMVMFEQAPLQALARDGQLMAYKHEGFWAAMDTLHDKRTLEDIWASGHCPWVTWEQA